MQKVNPSNGEVATTPERFALKPTRPEDDFERRLKEYQETKIRLEMDSPVSASTSNLGKTVLSFSPIGESTKISAAAPKTPSQSNMTPLLRRLMIRNAEDDKRERANLMLGRMGGPPKPLPVLDETRNGRMSMDLTALWGANDTNHRAVSMAEETVDLSADEVPSQPERPQPNRSSIMQTLRRQTMLFTSNNASMDISPVVAKENVAGNQDQSLYNVSVEAMEENMESQIKVPKICATQRKSLEEDTLRDDIVRAKEELLCKAVVINKSNKRRSLLPSSSVAEESSSKSNRRRTLFSVAAISDGGLSPPGPRKAASKRKTLSKADSSMASSSVDEDSSQGLAKKPKSSCPILSQPVAIPSQSQRRVTNMGPPDRIPIVKSKVVAAAASTSSTTGNPPKGDSQSATNKRKLFSSLTELPPIESPKRPSVAAKTHSRPNGRIVARKEPSTDSIAAVGKDSMIHPTVEKTTSTISGKSKGRRSTMDFQQTSASVPNSSALWAGRGSNAPAARHQQNVIVLTNGQPKQLDFIKEVNLCGPAIPRD